MLGRAPQRTCPRRRNLDIDGRRPHCRASFGGLGSRVRKEGAPRTVVREEPWEDRPARGRLQHLEKVSRTSRHERVDGKDMGNAESRETYTRTARPGPGIAWNSSCRVVAPAWGRAGWRYGSQRKDRPGRIVGTEIEGQVYVCEVRRYIQTLDGSRRKGSLVPCRF